ncbi:asparagine synthase-related protein [Spirillospora sp. NPDC048911]|uniref:asparagine synthase-related protein n=1 Tax=Spirillospora sp. NPDC048911 TaxID=3364527 RepID=UPI00371F4614
MAGPSWFAALPDHPSAERAAGLLRGARDRGITHPSGRPWIVGSWADGEVTTGCAGATAIAVIGQHSADPGLLAGAAGRITAPGGADRLAASLAGAFHLIVSTPAGMRVQGTVSAVRRVFHADIGGCTVAADQAYVLGDVIDEERLALHLLDPGVLHPLAGRPVWRGVEVVPGDRYLIVGDPADGAPRTVRRWAVPEPAVPMAEGAPALRDALVASVEARTRAHALVSCDLGGLDSTALCCVAARCGPALVAYTAETNDPDCDDERWARLTVAGLGGVEHHVIPAREMPLTYDGLLTGTELDTVLDEPCAVAVDRERFLSTVRRAGARGSRLHFAGIGGDELFYGSLAHLHALVRRRPRVALRHARGFAVKYRWKYGRMARQLADGTPYGAWLARVAGNLTLPPEGLDVPLFDWGFEPRLPPWTTPAAVAAVRTRIEEAARHGVPMAGDRGQHRELESIRSLSRTARLVGRMAALDGVTYATPYYDDRVLEAALAVRPEERITPWRYKPLIVEAMRGIVPERSRARQTKANGTSIDEPGLRRHRADLLALCDDSRLARLGLIDAAALREICLRPQSEDELGRLYTTVACEVWLRAHDRRIAATRGRTHDASPA